MRQLDQKYPNLHDERTPASSTATIGTPVEQLDLGTVIKASHAVSGEIVLVVSAWACRSAVPSSRTMPDGSGLLRMTAQESLFSLRFLRIRLKVRRQVSHDRADQAEEILLTPKIALVVVVVLDFSSSEGTKLALLVRSIAAFRAG